MGRLEGRIAIVTGAASGLVLGTGIELVVEEQRASLSPARNPLDCQQIARTRVVKGFGCDRHGPLPSLYRQKRTPFAGAENGAIRGARTYHQSPPRITQTAAWQASRLARKISSH